MQGLLYYRSPIGLLRLESDETGLCALQLCGEASDSECTCPLLERTRTQLAEYFAGQRRCFDLPLSLHGTPFQLAAWAALCRIPYGQTRTYGQQAAMLGRPRACRAVGMANHRNPILIIVPCHRVIGADGSLVGYGAGLDVKRALLTLEGAL